MNSGPQNQKITIKKILIVDDMRENIYLLVTLLKGNGYEVVSAENGVEALEKLKKENIDMIISDILMPKMDGFQLCRECKSDEILRKIPFIFYTATYTDKKDEEFALGLGADKFLIKPLAPDEFIKRLNSFIEEYKYATYEAPKIPIKEEGVYLVEYNERLIVKLEKKMLDLEIEVEKSKQAEERAVTSLREKEILLREIYHRTKNNMQVICALIDLQSEYSKDEQVLKLFKATEVRIKAMALAHEKLYQSKNLSRINLKSYIEDLSERTFKAYQMDREKISLKIIADDVSLSIDQAVPFGLVINEIISNSLKHAFPDNSEGEVKIKLCSTDNGEIELRVADNGIGMPKDFDISNTNTLGLQIITNLVRNQLKGKVDVGPENGVEYLIKFRETERPIRV